MSLVILIDPVGKCRSCTCYIPIDRLHGYCDFYGHNVAGEKECCASYAPGRAALVEG